MFKVFFVILLTFCALKLEIQAAVDVSKRVASMQQQISLLGNKQSFIPVELNLENSFLDRLIVNPHEDYEHYGHLEQLMLELPDFLRSIGNTDEQLINYLTQAINTLACDVSQAVGKETACVVLRAPMPSDDYNQPRWHTDGYYYPPYQGISYKFVTTLKGASTLFYVLPDIWRKEFIDTELNRELWNTRLNPCHALSFSRKGVFFIVGDQLQAAVHSEPPIHEERLFLAIIPGNIEEIEALYQFWNPTQ